MPHQDPDDPETILDATVTKADLAETVFGPQTAQFGLHAHPAVLDAIHAEGDTSAEAFRGQEKSAASVASRVSTEGGLARPTHAAVVCSDDLVTSPRDMNLDPASSSIARAYGQSSLDDDLGLCRLVDVPLLPGNTDIDVTTLSLAGEPDAPSPRIPSVLVAATLPHAGLVAFNGGMHVQRGEINLCAADILRAFLDDADAVPDMSCVAQIPRRAFVLPDGTQSFE